MKNNYWHKHEPGSESVLVFVHGFMSNSSDCWTAKNGAFWPELVAQDNRIIPMSIFMGGYHTGVLVSEYGVAECAEELFSALGRVYRTGVPSPVSHSNIIFLCHSLGGIVVRSMLERHAAAFHAKTIGLCLMASPSMGAGYASFLSPVTRFLRLKTGRQLEFSSGFLTDLDDRFMAFLNGRPNGTTFGAEAIEHKSQIPVIGRFLPKTVEKYSAARYFALRRTLPATNHSSIVKPTSVDSESHSFFIDFLSNNFCFLMSTGASLVSSSTKENEFDVLFSSYRAGLESYYIEREIDARVSRSWAHRNVWVSGPSGVGKTCILKRFVSRKGESHLEICLSQCTGTVCRDRLIQEVYECVCGYLDATPVNSGVYQDLVRILQRDPSITLYVHIDEVGSGESCNAAEELISVLADLITSCGQRDSAPVRFVVSSLHFPNFKGMPKGEKITEYFDFIECGYWGQKDIVRLIEVIDSKLDVLQSAGSSAIRLAAMAGGSPRFVKNVFRRLTYMKMDGVPLEIERAATEANREMVT